MKKVKTGRPIGQMELEFEPGSFTSWWRRNAVLEPVGGVTSWWRRNAVLEPVGGVLTMDTFRQAAMREYVREYEARVVRHYYTTPPVSLPDPAGPAPFLMPGRWVERERMYFLYPQGIGRIDGPKSGD